jgi:hypothetical protein
MVINEKSKQRSDLGLIMLQALFHNLADDFTLATLDTDPCTGSADPLRGKKVVQSARHFARIGFAPIGKSGYMFVEESQIPRAILPKEATSKLEVYEPPAARNLSVLDKELIESLGDLKKVKALITKGADPKNADALHHACANKAALPTLKYLISKGCDIDGKDTFQQTPLMVAACLGEADAVCNLLSLGADPRCVDDEGRTALDAFNTSQQSRADSRVCFGMPPDPSACSSRIRSALGEPAQASRKRRRE